jgi:hypothetical protein
MESPFLEDIRARQQFETEIINILDFQLLLDCWSINSAMHAWEEIRSLTSIWSPVLHSPMCIPNLSHEIRMQYFHEFECFRIVLISGQRGRREEHIQRITHPNHATLVIEVHMEDRRLNLEIIGGQEC